MLVDGLRKDRLADDQAQDLVSLSPRSALLMVILAQAGSDDGIEDQTWISDFGMVKREQTS